jgi:hypothetical protein
MAIRSITKKGGFEPRLITVSGFADPGDSIWASVEVQGLLVGTIPPTIASFGEFTLSEFMPFKGDCTVYLHARASGQGAVSPPFPITVTVI